MRPNPLTLLSALLLVGCSTPMPNSSSTAVAEPSRAPGSAQKSKVTPPPPTVRKVDLNRYMGEWFVIAHVPYFLEKGKVAASDTYRMRPDGKMDNIYTFRKKSFDAPEKKWNGVAWVVNHETNAEWKVRLFWPLTSTYLILHLDPDYRWSVVGTPNGKLLWILAKKRALPEHEYQDILELVAKDGYDVSKIQKVPQPAS